MKKRLTIILTTLACLGMLTFGTVQAGGSLLDLGVQGGFILNGSGEGEIDVG